MSKELTTTNPVNEIKEINEVVAALMEQPHYKKMGQQGVFAVVSMAKALGIDPLQAINGGLYPVGGKVEMTSQTMNQVIRQAGHSIKKDPKSNSEICILHGRRADTGDTWTCSFSFEEAKTAGLVKAGGPWYKYRQDMLFARALTRLARQLFPDVIRGCYVREHGQSELDPSIDILQDSCAAPATLDEEHAERIEEVVADHPDLKEKLLRQIQEVYDGSSFMDLPVDDYESTVEWLNNQITKRKKEERAVVYPGVDEEDIA